MSENTKIEWATHTFNPWEGCQKAGPGCDHCYAESRNARFGGGVAINGPTRVAELADLIGHTSRVEISNLGIRLGKLHKLGELTRVEVDRKFIYEVAK